MSNINWILHNSASDYNYTCTVPRLTDEELLHCLANETRKSGLTQLNREAKKRGWSLDEKGEWVVLNKVGV